jgi:hypothetical protein
MKILIHPHALRRMRERGASAAQVRQAVLHGEPSPAKYGRRRFRSVLPFGARWNGKHFAFKQIDVFAATMHGGWIVETVIVKYF